MKAEKIFHECMRGLGLALLLFGALAVVDGILPMRSHGPNPSWLEIGLGIALCVAGFVLRKLRMEPNA